MKRHLFWGGFLLFTVILLGGISLKGAAQDDTTFKKLRVFNNLLNRADSFAGKSGGQQVDPIHAHRCIHQFPESMRRHGILKKRNKLTVRVRRSVKITEMEIFGSRDMLNWMNAVVDKYDHAGQGLNLAVDIRFGMYDKEFADTYLQGRPDYDDRIGRIGIFLVMRYKQHRDKATGQLIPGARLDDDDDVAAFDLGALQP